MSEKNSEFLNYQNQTYNIQFDGMRPIGWAQARIGIKKIKKKENQ